MEVKKLRSVQAWVADLKNKRKWRYVERGRHAALLDKGYSLEWLGENEPIPTYSGALVARLTLRGWAIYRRL
jgi:hypothetical protein